MRKESWFCYPLIGIQHFASLGEILVLKENSFLFNMAPEWESTISSVSQLKRLGSFLNMEERLAVLELPCQ